MLETEVTLEPEKNIKLMGFYRSGGTWCTQCEPEGFRRITYYLDRPDVLAPFKVTMTADKTLAPVLLANGNLIDKRRPRGRHAFRGVGGPLPQARLSVRHGRRRPRLDPRRVHHRERAARSRSASMHRTASRRSACGRWIR